eukprot:843890-Pyramimonas_sp.AAC.1
MGKRPNSWSPRNRTPQLPRYRSELKRQDITKIFHSLQKFEHKIRSDGTADMRTASVPEDSCPRRYL